MDELRQQLAPLREQIDNLDLQLIELLNTRARLAQQGGKIKQQLNAVAFQPERERQVLRNLEKANPGPLPNTSIHAIWREIMSACCALEETLKVAYLGPAGTFSEVAALDYFGHGMEGIACVSLDEVFRNVETGAAQYGVVPIENSSEGAVSRTLDLLLQSSLYISGERSLPIHHHLLHQNGVMDTVTTVRAHPQALAQCQHWLNTHYPHLERQAVSSNALAAQLCATDPHSVAIAGTSAAKQYGLYTVHSHIQDDTHNRTRFIILSRVTAAASGNDQTSLILSVPNHAGAVYQLLAPLAEHGVSMCRIESRPARKGAWEYYFYIDIEGHREQEHVARALTLLEQQAAFYKLLGSYPRGSR